MKPQWIDGRLVYPGGATEYRRDVAEREVARERQRLREDEERRREVIKKEDEAYEARQRERRESREREQRERAEAEVAAKRATVERDCRLAGVPDRDLTRVVDEAMTRYHVARAQETAERGDRTKRELEAFFRTRPAPSFE